MVERVYIKEKGESFVELTLAQAMELQDLRFCRVTPTPVPGRWRVSDVLKVGVAVVGGCELHVVPKTPLENIVFMASLGGLQLHLGPDQIGYGSDRSIPTAIARAFLLALHEATRRGLLKGYRSVQASAAVVRGRWDIPRQLAMRPGIPLPVEIEFDDFTGDIDENRILLTALRVLARLDGPANALGPALTAFRVLFSDVESLPRGTPLPDVPLNRLNQHYGVPLRLARVILEAVSWTSREGATIGGTFLIDMAAVFEGYVANRLRANLAEIGFSLTAQDRSRWFDVDKSVALRPDIVISHDGAPVAVADTKYKVLGGGDGAIPNGDVYQAVAYALAFGVGTAHLIYVSGDVVARVLQIRSAGVQVHIHAIQLEGSARMLEAGAAALGAKLVGSVQVLAASPRRMASAN
jgi:5-methylcytosine-specific restriction enzyme subunit McrC